MGALTFLIAAEVRLLPFWRREAGRGRDGLGRTKAIVEVPESKRVEYWPIRALMLGT